MPPSIVWIMYVALIIYNILDSWQTILLLHVGGEELNPIMNFFIQLSGSEFIIMPVKAVPIIGLGVLLGVYHKRLLREEINGK